MEPVDFLDLCCSGIDGMDRVGARVVGRGERDKSRHGLEDGGILGEDKVSKKPISSIRRDGGCIGIELDL